MSGFAAGLFYLAMCCQNAKWTMPCSNRDLRTVTLVTVAESRSEIRIVHFAREIASVHIRASQRDSLARVLSR